MSNKYAPYVHSYTVNSPERETTAQAIARVHLQAACSQEDTFISHDLCEERITKSASLWHVCFHYLDKTVISSPTKGKHGYKSREVSYVNYLSWMLGLSEDNAVVMQG